MLESESSHSVTHTHTSLSRLLFVGGAMTKNWTQVRRQHLFVDEVYQSGPSPTEGQDPLRASCTFGLNPDGI